MTCKSTNRGIQDPVDPTLKEAAVLNQAVRHPLP
jgi:hypothetical protein